MKKQKISVVGSGNAALCAAIAALEKGATVQLIEKADEAEAGGNTRYTAGAMRFAYTGIADLLPLLAHPDDQRIAHTEFGAYPTEKFRQDLLAFNGGRPLSMHQEILIDRSYETMRWLSRHSVKFEPIYARQAFQKDGKQVFWGGLTLAAQGEGVGLFEAQLAEVLRLGGKVRYETEAKQLIRRGPKVVGIACDTPQGAIELYADHIVLACGGFEANPELRRTIMGEKWARAKVRGTPHNQGAGLQMALDAGADFHGLPEGCHAVPVDRHMPDYGNTDLPHLERKNYRKICYFLGVMLNADGERFVDEGENFRNYTYAQFGRAILDQPGSFAWQIFDKKVEPLLYDEYRFWDARYVEADTLEALVEKLDGVDARQALATLTQYNHAVDEETPFDPTVLDGKGTSGLAPNKTNWANTLDTPPFKAYPVTCGITFTYGGLKVDENAAVLDTNDRPIEGLFACGELVGGVFYEGYPGGSGLTSGAVFGRLAGFAAAQIGSA